MIIYFLRHANAGVKRKDPKKDEKRPLDAMGIEQCGEVGRALAAMDTTIDALISSPLKRATQTAALVGNEIGYEGKLHTEKALRPEASFELFREMLRKYSKADAIMLVGHNPNFSEFLGKAISQRNGSAYVELKKGSVARVEKAGHHATLHWFLTPRVVQAIADQQQQLLNGSNPPRLQSGSATPAESAAAKPGKAKKNNAKEKKNRKKGHSASKKSSRPKTSRK